MSKVTSISGRLLGDIRKMIEETRAGVAATVNAGLTMLYWRIGSRINQEILNRTPPQISLVHPLKIWQEISRYLYLPIYYLS